MNNQKMIPFNKQICLLAALIVALSTALVALPYSRNYLATAQTAQNESDEDAETLDDDELTDEDAEEEINPAHIQSLSERIQKVKEQNGSVAGQTNYTTRAIVGVIERLSESTMTVESLKGPVIIPLTADTQLIKNNRMIEVSDIEIENSAIVLGLQTGESFTPIKVIIEDDDLMPRSQIVEIGTIEEITASSLSLSARLDASTKTFTINQNTTVIDADNDTIRASDLFEDVQVIVIGYTNESSSAEEKPKVAQIIKALAALERTE